ncbi:molybdopterin-dependent oxidoreductase [Sciscionella sediminilitoris]|uniref:molybdopterin-dependent oxidoreductase n=1 Tax=Sciscionella sediminilitoris TaxID=1445613 RepID=UPI0004DF6C7C|nr:molybdopterin-dependent oxidoreductase [Sciscionella sp. SE31]
MDSPTGRIRFALIGLLAAAAALGAGQLVAGFLGPGYGPLTVVGDAAVDLSPQPLKEWAIRAFGESDKTVLFAGAAVVLAAAAVLAGLGSRRRSGFGFAVIGLFGMAGLAAGIAERGARGAIAPLVAVIAGLAVFGLLRAAAVSNRVEPSIGRRRFLLGSVGVGAGAAVAWFVGDTLAGAGDTQRSRLAVGSLRPRTPAPPIPAGADFAGSGTPRFITPNPEFYRIDTALSVPAMRAEDYRLRVHGMVERELELGYEDLRERGLVAKTITMTCVSNEVGGEYISTATFVGVPIHEVLTEAGIRPGAQQVFSTSADGFTAGTPLDVLHDPRRGALLALGMNGEPLPAEHGFPVRMVTPGLYGYVSATKWLVDLEITTFAKQAYWEQRGWGKWGPIKTESRIDRPRAGERVPEGRTMLAGIAWAQHTGIEAVEVRVDGGPWQCAQLSTEVSADTWRMWRIPVELGRGEHTIQCRATDRSGYTQTEARADPVPDGATGWHTVLVTADPANR